jgi:hypothetical protein
MVLNPSEATFRIMLPGACRMLYRSLDMNGRSTVSTPCFSRYGKYCSTRSRFEGASVGYGTTNSAFIARLCSTCGSSCAAAGNCPAGWYGNWLRLDATAPPP